MKTLKKMLRKHELPLQQIIKRYHEKINSDIDKKTETNFSLCKNKHTEGPILEHLTGSQYKTIYLKYFTIKTHNNAHNFLVSKNHKIFQVKNIVEVDNTNKIALVGHKFLSKNSYYEQHIDSYIFNIYKVDCLSSQITVIFLEEIKKKVMLVELKDGTKIAVPLIHSQNC